MYVKKNPVHNVWLKWYTKFPTILANGVINNSPNAQYTASINEYSRDEKASIENTAEKEHNLEHQLNRLLEAWKLFNIDPDMIFRKLALMLLISETELYVKDVEYRHALNEAAGELRADDPELESNDFAGLISQGYDNFNQ